jgi:hypothetical protein
LLPFLGGASSVIDVEIEHNALVYATVVAENNAGLRAVFKGGPIKYDNTPPVITDLKTSIIENNNHKESNGTDDSLVIVVNWNVMDHESGVKYCVCWLGRAKFQFIYTNCMKAVYFLLFYYSIIASIYEISGIYFT